MVDDLRFKLASPRARLDGRAPISLLVVVAAIGLLSFPFYREHSRSAVLTAEAADQADGTAISQADAFQIPTRLAYHTNGTVSVWFQGQENSIYRIDYTDTKTTTPEAMQWQVAVDDVVANSGWTEWVDAGATNRSAPGEVNERYYRVVLKTLTGSATASATGETIEQTPTVSEAQSSTTSTNQSAQTPATGENDGSQLVTLTAAESLQEYARLGELVAGGTATQDELNGALKDSRLSISKLIALGRDLLQAGDRQHALSVFEAIIQDHALRATAKQLARSHLAIAGIHQEEALDRWYQLRDAEGAELEFKAAISSYLTAKDSSHDWVREVGWLEAAACYRELGNQNKRRECLEQLLAENQCIPAHRDMASYLLANSYYEQKRFTEAAQVYQQMQARLDTRLAANPEEYRGQRQYLDLAATGLAWCTARQAEREARSQVNSHPVERRVAP